MILRIISGIGIIVTVVLEDEDPASNQKDNLNK
jgi:hypothetical protein